jgi:hypothetical protein
LFFGVLLYDINIKGKDYEKDINNFVNCTYISIF